jgi:hypothetical protein
LKASNVSSGSQRAKNTPTVDVTAERFLVERSDRASARRRLAEKVDPAAD